MNLTQKFQQIDQKSGSFMKEHFLRTYGETENCLLLSLIQHKCLVVT